MYMYDYKLLQVSCENFAFDMFDRILESLMIVLLNLKLCYFFARQAACLVAVC